MKNNFSKNASDFVNEVEKFSGDILNKKAVLLRIYEETIKSGKEKKFEELIFTAKYLRDIIRRLQNDSLESDPASLEKIKKNFSVNIRKFIKQLKELTENSDEQLKSYFEENYYKKSEEVLINLNELLSDLEWTMMYLNQYKENE